MNKIAAAAVNLARKGVAPELPKKVWLAPPKAAPMPAPRPDCSNTMKINARANDYMHDGNNCNHNKFI